MWSIPSMRIGQFGYLPRIFRANLSTIAKWNCRLLLYKLWASDWVSEWMCAVRAPNYAYVKIANNALKFSILFFYIFNKFDHIWKTKRPMKLNSRILFTISIRFDVNKKIKSNQPWTWIRRVCALFSFNGGKKGINLLFVWINEINLHRMEMCLERKKITTISSVL